MPNGSAWTH